MEAVDEEGEHDFEEELSSENKEAPSANEDDALASTIPTPVEPTLTKYDILAINMKELKA